MVDENANPGRYGFKIFHDSGVAHFFSSDEQIAIREWMKALMKATIGRDYTSARLHLLHPRLQARSNLHQQNVRTNLGNQ